MRSGRPPAGKAYRGVRRARRRPPRTRIATRIAALLRVDLGLLQLARKVHVDRLPLREHIDPGDPRLAAAGQELPFPFADLDVLRDGLALRLRDTRPHVDAVVQSVADLELLRARDEPVFEFAEHLPMDQEARGRRAALPRRSESSPHGA